jgi:hypothetical protein
VRLPRSLAWTLVLLTFFTAGLLRQFHDQTPYSPYVPPIVGSLLFAAVLFLLLVAARERRLGAVRGPGVRLGSITGLLLMLLVEKWVSLALYNPAFYAIGDSDAPASYLDAWYRAFAGAGLLAVCLLVSRFSPPASRRTWKRSRPGLWPAAAFYTVAIVGGAYLVLWIAGTSRGARIALWWPAPDMLWLWVFGGQAVRAFAEEVYYRGLLLSEMQRLAPRLGLRSAAARRWVPLVVTSVLFGMEHLYLGPPEEMIRRLVFTVSLGLLLGMIVLASSNLHLAAGIHAWINWLLLGAAPRFVDGSGEPAIAPGAYVGIALALAFVLLFAVAARRGRRDRLTGRTA